MGGTDETGASLDGGAEAAAATVDAAPAPGISEKGVMIDYETLSPLPGLTVTDNGVSATTDEAGAYSLTVPSTATALSPFVTGANYGTLFFPTVSPASPDGGAIDFGTNVIGDLNTVGLEMQILQNDPKSAVVQIVVQPSGGCTSVAGGTLQVLSPPNTKVQYFSRVNIPDPSLTAFTDVVAPRPVAVVYNVALGSQLTVSVTHPTCTLVPFPTPSLAGVQELTGQSVTVATQPGDQTSALVLVMQ